MMTGCALPATGQTTCWDSSGNVIPCADTGQDGDIQAGEPLSYTDNADGTITDNNTGLLWEKLGQDGSIHDVGNTYTWNEAFSVHVASLNSTSFAGHSDWRLPNVKELQSILNYGTSNPAVSPAFNANCTPGCMATTCSCTAASFYWSSSSFAANPSLPWLLDFFTGGTATPSKTTYWFMRAVRGGS